MFRALRPALASLSPELGLMLASAGWLVAVLATLLLARGEWLVAAVAAGGVVGFARLVPGRGRWRTLALVALSLAAFLTVAEAAIRLRFFGGTALRQPLRYEPSGAMANPDYLAPASEPGVIYTLRPGFDGWVKGVRVTANSAGLRDREWSVEASPGRRRVLTLGTSLTMGEGVAVEDTFTRRAGRVLERDGLAVETLNFGVGGHVLGTGQALLEARGVRFHPDVVVQELAVMAARQSERTVEQLRASYEQTRATPLRTSVFEARSFALHAIYPPLSLRQRLAQVLMTPTATASSEADYLERLLDRFARLGREHGFRGVVFVPRPIDALGVRELHRREREGIRALAQERELTYVDSYDRFGGADVVEDLIIFPGDLHPNARGHARHAEALARALVPLLRGARAS